MFKLGCTVTDTATEHTGTVVGYFFEMSGNQLVAFQPRGINPETGHPVDSIWVAEARLVGGVQVDLPDHITLAVLGTEVEDIASGFKGMAVSAQLYMNGCLHLNVQPAGTLAKTGAPIASCNFDIRRLKGKFIKTLDEVEKAASERRHPSPMNLPVVGVPSASVAGPR